MFDNRQYINVVGAGLAGCEAAHQLASRQIPVKLYEMKALEMSPAHHSPDLAELVCSRRHASSPFRHGVVRKVSRLNDLAGFFSFTTRSYT